jgi:hypothetical protein
MFDGYAKMPLIDPAYVVSPDCYVGTTGVFDPGAARRPLTVFPNPARVSAEVAFRSAAAFPARLTVHSLGGALVHGQAVTVQPGSNVYFISVKQLPPATYFIRLENARTGEAEVVKLAVAR